MKMRNTFQREFRDGFLTIHVGVYVIEYNIFEVGLGRLGFDNRETGHRTYPRFLQVLQPATDRPKLTEQVGFG